MYMEKIPILLDSEVGKLNAVILHKPGIELERMTPATIKEALFSDLLSEQIATAEYSQVQKVLSKVSQPLYYEDLLPELLIHPEAKAYFLERVCSFEHLGDLRPYFDQMSPEDLARYMIEGMSKEEIKRVMHLDFSKEIVPLYNLYFTRDTCVAFNNKTMATSMTHAVRKRENILVDTVFRYHPLFSDGAVNHFSLPNPQGDTLMEGGDFLVFAENIFLIGMGSRTTQKGIEAFIETQKKASDLFYIITQELPKEPESFIHLDMVFTLLDREVCMAYKPVIMDENSLKTTLIKVENGQVSSELKSNIPAALKDLNHSLDIVYCGGNNSLYMQREQWHSGANFFCFAPGQIMGYGRNLYTIEALNNAGFEVVSANDFSSSSKYDKVVVTIESSELVRGGGGCRCMTMPINRMEI